MPSVQLQKLLPCQAPPFAWIILETLYHFIHKYLNINIIFEINICTTNCKHFNMEENSNEGLSS